MRNKKKNAAGRCGAAVRAGVLALVLTFMVCVCACGRETESENNSTKVILTTGFARGEIFRIGPVSCMKSELMVYLTNTQNQYENVFGEEIWQQDFNGVTLEENVKEIVLARIARIKSMTLLAEEMNVSLSEEEQALCGQAAAEYFSSLSGREQELLEITQEEISSMYQDYALADKVYHYIIRDINPEISDDEARTITIQHILLRTTTGNADGGFAMSEEEKAERYALAQELSERLEAGEDFESLMELYNEADENTLYIRHGDMDEAFENAAFSLETGEISEIVETTQGYEILKCISTFDREQTDQNKIEIVRAQREQVFGEQYETFVSSLMRYLNEDLWEEIRLLHDAELRTSDFFEVYNRSFAGTEFSFEE
ncbi:MAG: peptidylprolyl isomerase [bacterium]|nr:peptidylprolyl isomerase [bacterium]